MSFCHSISSFNSLINNDGNLNPTFQLSSQSQSTDTSEPLTMNDDVSPDLFTSIKKIKVEDIQYHSPDNRISELLPNSIHTVKTASKAIKIPIKAAEILQNVNTRPSEPKNLFVKGHCYNLKGFANKGCDTVTVVTGKREHPDFQNRVIMQNSAQEFPRIPPMRRVPIASRPPLNKVLLDCPNLSLNENDIQSRVERMEALIQMKQRMRELRHLRFMRDFQRLHNLEEPRPALTQLNPNILMKAHPQAMPHKPLSRIAQTYIQQKALGKAQRGLEIPTQANNVTEIRAKDLSKATLEFSSSTFNVTVNKKSVNKLGDSYGSEGSNMTSPEPKVKSLANAPLSPLFVNRFVDQQLLYLREQALKGARINFERILKEKLGGGSLLP